VTFSYPIGNRAAENAERAARAALRSARLVHDDLQSRIVAEVRLSQRRVIFAAEAVSAAETSVSLARRQLEAEEARFREGLATNFQVLEFQEDLTLAQFTLVQAHATFVKARAALARSQGLLVEDGGTP
jgi:outer membrane protein TolC